MGAYETRASTERQLGCADLPCVDIGVGIYHHPMCGYEWNDDDELFGPLSPEDEEELPPDPAGEE